jgi:hypothetical protein
MGRGLFKLVTDIFGANIHGKSGDIFRASTSYLTKF